MLSSSSSLKYPSQSGRTNMMFEGLSYRVAQPSEREMISMLEHTIVSDEGSQSIVPFKATYPCEREEFTRGHAISTLYTSTTVVHTASHTKVLGQPNYTHQSPEIDKRVHKHQHALCTS